MEFIEAEKIDSGTKILKKKYNNLETSSEIRDERFFHFISANSTKIIIHGIIHSLNRTSNENKTIVKNCIEFFSKPDMRAIISIGAHPRTAQNLFDTCINMYNKFKFDKRSSTYIMLLRSSIINGWYNSYNLLPKSNDEKRIDDLVPDIVMNTEEKLLLALKWLARAYTDNSDTLNNSRELIEICKEQVSGIRCDALQILCEEADKLNKERRNLWLRTHDEKQILKSLWIHIHMKAKKNKNLM